MRERFTDRRAPDHRFKFDRTINLGHLLSIIAFVLTVFAAYSGIISRMDKMEVKVDAMWQVFAKNILQ